VKVNGILIDFFFLEIFSFSIRSGGVLDVCMAVSARSLGQSSTRASWGFCMTLLQELAQKCADPPPSIVNNQA
jgi:hypothetical protein